MERTRDSNDIILPENATKKMAFIVRIADIRQRWFYGGKKVFAVLIIKLFEWMRRGKGHERYNSLNGLKFVLLFVFFLSIYQLFWSLPPPPPQIQN